MDNELRLWIIVRVLNPAIYPHRDSFSASKRNWIFYLPKNDTVYSISSSSTIAGEGVMSPRITALS